MNPWVQIETRSKNELCPYGSALAYELAHQNIADFNHRKSYDHITLKLLLVKRAGADTTCL